MPGTQFGAVVIMLGASALVAGTTLIAKTLGLGTAGTALHPLQISAGRFAFALMLLSIVAIRLRPSFRGSAWGLHVSRSVCGWLGVTCMFAAAARLPLAETTAITFLSPIITMGLAVLMLRERVGRWRAFAAGIAVVGALILTRPGTEAFQLAALIALAAAFFVGLEAIFIKRLSDTEPPMRILLVNNALGTIIALLAASTVWVTPDPTSWLLLMLLGVTMVGAQALFIQALRRGEASHIMPLFYMTLVFAAAYDYLLFSLLPDLPAALGALLIVAGAVLIALRGGPARRRS